MKSYPRYGRNIAAAAILAISGHSLAVTPVDWNDRIVAALKQSGSVSSVAEELGRSSDPSDEAAAAKVRVDLEQGQLQSALLLLQKQMAQRPDDAGLLERSAEMQAMSGLVDPADQGLSVALASTHDPLEKNAIALKLATLFLDTGRIPDGLALLDSQTSSDPSIAAQAGMIACLYGQYAAAEKYLSLVDHRDVMLQLLTGNAALNAGQTDTAKVAFAAAFQQANKPGDKIYAQERLIAAARQSGSMETLADAWLADTSQHTERLLPLAAMLRELGRVNDLLKLWRDKLHDPATADVATSDRFVNEVLGAAQSAGRGSETIQICRELLKIDPDNHQWLTATVRVLQSQGNTADADAVLTDRVNASTEDPAQLQEICRLARSLRRDAVAIDAAKKIESFGGAQKITGQLLQASIWQRAGDRSKVAELLKSAEAEAPDHPAAVEAVVGALEAAGLDEDAIDLLHRVPLSEQSTDRLMLLVSLLLTQHRPAEAVPALEQVLRSNASPAMRAQAGQQLIDTAEQSHSLKELVARTQARVDADQGDAQDLSLLVDGNLHLKDVASAVRALQQTKLLDQPEKLRRLAILYIRQKDLAHAEQTLRELVDADPAGAAETLEREASVQLAQNKTQDATKGINEIERRIGAGPTSSELMAGVLDRLGRKQDAARQYRRALALMPEKSEDWLLWATAQAKAGNATAARGRLQVLCSEAADDNLFAVGVDGLLNLKAAPLVLREVRRQAVLRLAERPRSMILYYVISDLSDELADPVMMTRATEASIAANDETRGQRLRELMNIASQKGMTDTAVACGRSLVALGDEFPPQMYFQLAEQLLVTNHLADASRALARATESADPEMVANRAAALFEKYDYPAEALAALLPFAEHNRRDEEYVKTLARLEEITGRTDAACDDYLTVIQLSGAELASDLEPARPTGVTGQETFLLWDSSRLFESLNQAVAGAIATADSPARQNQLIELLQSQVNHLVADPSTAAPTNTVVGMVAALRRAAFAFNRVDVADHADAEVIARWPASRPLKTLAVEARLRDGYFEQALVAARTYDIPANNALRAAARYLSDRSSIPNTIPTAMTVEAAADLLPTLILHNQLDEVRQVIHRVEPVVKDPPEITPSYGMAGRTLSPIRVIIQAAALVNDGETVNRWIQLWLDAIGRSAATPILFNGKPAAPGTSDYRMTNLYSRLISTTWRLLTPESQAVLARRLCDQVSQLPASVAGAKTITVALQLAAAVDEPIDTKKLVENVELNGSDAAVMARIFNLLPMSQRSAFVTNATPRLPAPVRLTFLLDAVEQSSVSFDAATQSAVISAANELPAGQSANFPEQWCINATNVSVLPALAEALLRSSSQPAHLVQAAAAMSVAGNSARADAIALQAIQLLGDQPPIIESEDPTAKARTQRVVQPDRVGLLRAAIAAMSPASRATLFKESSSSTTNMVWRNLVDGTLLDSSGPRDDGLVAFRNAFIPNPADVSVTRAYTGRLEEDGRLAELVEALSHRNFSADMDGVNERKALSRGLVALFRWREVRATGGDFDPGAFLAPDFMTPVAGHDSAGLARALEEMLQLVRGIHGSLPLIRTADAGGLRSLVDASKSPLPFDDVAHDNQSLDSLLSAMHMPSASNNIAATDAPDWLSTAVVQLAKDGEAREQILKFVESSASSHTLSRAERQVIARLAAQPGNDIPDDLLAALWPAAAADSTGVELGTLSDALVARHSASGEVMRRWADILAGGTPTLPLLHPKPNPRLDPLPIEALTDAGIADWAEQALSHPAADHAAIAQQLDRLGSTGAITSSFVRCGLIRARLAAEAGRMDEYENRLGRLLHWWAWVSAGGQAVSRPPTNDGSAIAIALPDIRQSLPTDLGSQSRMAMLASAQRVLVELSKQWPGNTDITRELASLGEWARVHEEPDAAEAIYLSANALAQRQGIGEHLLWVADLADRLGKTEQSVELQQRLLAARCLPSIRIAELLDKMQHAGKAAEAARLGADAAGYCYEPTIQNSGRSPSAGKFKR